MYADKEILGERYNDYWGFESDYYDAWGDEEWTPSDELDWDEYEDEYTNNHCYPQEW